MKNRPSPFPRLDHISRARALLIEELKKADKKMKERDLSYVTLSPEAKEDFKRIYFAFRDKMKRIITIWFPKEADGSPRFEITPAIADEDRQIKIDAKI